jgi:hypothetical protein
MYYYPLLEYVLLLRYVSLQSNHLQAIYIWYYENYYTYILCSVIWSSCYILWRAHFVKFLTMKSLESAVISSCIQTLCCVSVYECDRNLLTDNLIANSRGSKHTERWRVQEKTNVQQDYKTTRGSWGWLQCLISQSVGTLVTYICLTRVNQRAVSWATVHNIGRSAFRHLASELCWRGDEQIEKTSKQQFQKTKVDPCYRRVAYSRTSTSVSLNV